MVDYHNPITVAHEHRTCSPINRSVFSIAEMMNFWHTVDGIFIWEFFTTLGYEWEVIRGRRPYRWTILIYSITRVATLLTIILDMVGFDSTAPIYCQIWVTFTALCTYTAFVSASLLIVLRAIAVWNMAKIAFVITMGVWVADVALFINGTVRIRSTWSPEANSCARLNLESTKPALIGSLITDVVLLLIMLSGVLRLRLEAVGAFDLGHILWKQGLNWLLLATVAEVPPLFLQSIKGGYWLNSNPANQTEPTSLIFRTPSIIIMSITATRMYRSLIDFASSDSSGDVPRENEHTVSELRVRSGTVPPSWMEVSTCRVSYIITDPHGHYKTHEVSLNVDVERGSEVRETTVPLLECWISLLTRCLNAIGLPY
ncbi:hypothetical protein F5888DRAFT_1890194 [Russula emetica]|nr:hypothetical protein F5888DRAFT_1890194 [Russula emetica]